MSSLEQILADHRGYDAETDLCACGTDLGTIATGRQLLPGLHAAHVADRIREWLLSDNAIDDAAEILFAHDFGNYSPDAHPDHNRWTWRGDGHTEEFKDGYRNVTRQALTAALDQGDQ